MADDKTGEAGEQAGSDDARLDKLEATQEEQGSKLDKILGILDGGKKDPPAAAPAAGEHATQQQEADSIADQVRKAVEAVGAEKAQKEAEDKHAADHAALAEAREKPPRESASGWRGKLQAGMYGKDQP